MYQALYRKYRPKVFDDVVGQEAIIKTLINEIINDKFSHAYIFAGPRGTGKTSVAKILAKTIVCEFKNDSTPCDKCVTCTQINKGQSVDIIEIDAASNNGVEEVRELKNKVNLVPSFGKYKIYIIDEVHMMTNSAFNALLKTLEEPPAHAIFILATTDPQKVPLTILSRCQRFDFKKINESLIKKQVLEISKKEKIKITDDAALEIARLSDGALRDAIGMLDQAFSYENKEITIKEVRELNGVISNDDIDKMLSYIYNGETIASLELVEEFDAIGRDHIASIDAIMFGIRNQIILDIKNNDNGKKLELLKKANDYLYKMKQSLNPKLLFEMFIIEASYKENKEMIKKEPEIINLDLTNPKKEEIKKDKDDEKDQKTEDTKNEKISVEFDKIKEIRINNALAGLDKKETKKIKEEMSNLEEFSVNTKFKKLVSLLIDGDLKAFGNNQIIYVFEENYCSDKFNDQLEKVEELIFKITGQKYKAIAVEKDRWEQIKKDFNSKIKKYFYIEDNFDIQMFAKKEKKEDANKITNTFGDIVKYK
jgi:DNA polymerase III subunit gamma/tau